MPPSAARLLSLWEDGRHALPLERGLLALAALRPDQPPAALAALSIGQRDAALLDLREQLFGPRFAVVSTCDGCGGRVEFALEAETVRQAAPPGDGAATYRLELGERTVAFRLPASADIAAVSAAPDAPTARAWLLARCVAGEEELDSAAADAVAATMAELDPAADVRIDVTCAICGRVWQAQFDIVDYLWTELDAWGWRTLREIHVLAQCYGWRESEILALSPARRQAYLQLIAGGR